MTTTALTYGTVEPVTWDRKRTDRCDRCGAEAFFKAEKKGHGDLLFCAHHGREHQPTLVGGGWCVLDYSHLLNDTPSPSANAD